MTPVAVAEVIELSDRRDMWLRRVYEAARAAYELGLEHGAEAQARAADRSWARGPLCLVPSGPTLAELEQRRWGPGGRERFGERRPGDYPGRRT